MNRLYLRFGHAAVSLDAHPQFRGAYLHQSGHLYSRRWAIRHACWKRVFPPSNLILGMDATDAANILLGSAIVIIAVSLIYTALFCGLAVHYLKKKYVNAIKIEESSWKRKNDNC